MLKTTLFETHKALKAKIVPFGGWQMPVSYEGVMAEHKAVREACGIFDVSHMGQIFVSGRDATSFLQRLTMNNIEKLAPGTSQYSAFLNESGGFVDDLIIYKLWDGDYLICVNAANIDKDHAWLMNHRSNAKVTIENKSDEYAQLAVQGPTSLAALSALLSPEDAVALSKLAYTHIMRASFQSKPVFIARTGYTGEKGFEVYLVNELAEAMWNKLLQTEAKTGIKPIGLGARDTLRLEACYLLYGNDMNETVSPLEAGVAWAVKLDCGDFLGRSALEQEKKNGSRRKMVAFKFEEEGIPRSGMEIYAGDKLIGRVTSGSVLPTVGGAGGMALVDAPFAEIGTKLDVDVRGKRKVASVVKRPLYEARVK